MSTKPLRVLSVMALLAAIDPSPRALAQTKPTAPAQPLDGAKLQQILDEAAAFMKSPGLVMSVQVGNGQPWNGVSGWQDEPGSRKMTTDMKFRVGSITKNFVGTAILQQVDEGKISLDDSLEKWLPGVFSNIDGKGITIRQLLSHTSGIETYTADVTWLSTVYMDPTHLWKAPTELLKMADELRAESIKSGTVIKPGSQFSYSNTNFILLGMIAAKIDKYADYDWEQVILNRFFKKLAMTNSRTPATAETQLGSTNHGYVDFYNFFGKDDKGNPNCLLVNPSCTDTDQDFTIQDMSNAWSAGEIISTVDDLRTWINAELKGTLLSPKIRKEQQQFINTCPAGQPSCETADVQAGLALFKQLKYGFIGHRGEIFGFNGTIQYLPQKDLTVVVLSNRTALDGNHVGPIPESVAAALFPDLDTKPRSTALKRLPKTFRTAPDGLSHFSIPKNFREKVKAKLNSKGLLPAKR